MSTAAAIHAGSTREDAVAAIMVVRGEPLGRVQQRRSTPSPCSAASIRSSW